MKIDLRGARDKFTNHVAFRLTEDESEALDAACELTQLSRSEFCRRVVASTAADVLKSPAEYGISDAA